MNYTYAYKTSDGARHEGSMDASSREEVFTVLRARGIRPIKVVAADGSKANGEKEEARRKRALALRLATVAALAVLASLASLLSLKSLVARNRPPGPTTATPRHQIYGDPATMESFERGEFGDALPREGDRLLAIFAQPGRLMCRRGFDPWRLNPEDQGAFADYAKDALAPDADIPVAPEDPREVRELKQIVNGMRQEMREYLANGNGTPRSYWRRLNERTQQEAQIYERTRRELEGEESPEEWERKNDALRRLGLRTIPTPKYAE
ncbi:MAG: hypothetical protein IJG84_19420 [Kiritimatiellae bacterium]|nr:hypothetical protein [Kiritimatiellia bacterium]